MIIIVQLAFYKINDIVTVAVSTHACKSCKTLIWMHEMFTNKINKVLQLLHWPMDRASPLIIGLPYDHPHTFGNQQFSCKTLGCYAMANNYYQCIRTQIKLRKVPSGPFSHGWSHYYYRFYTNTPACMRHIICFLRQ
jgi:hypothetical protein